MNNIKKNIPPKKDEYAYFNSKNRGIKTHWIIDTLKNDKIKNGMLCHYSLITNINPKYYFIINNGKITNIETEIKSIKFNYY